MTRPASGGPGSAPTALKGSLMRRVRVGHRSIRQAKWPGSRPGRTPQPISTGTSNDLTSTNGPPKPHDPRRTNEPDHLAILITIVSRRVGCQSRSVLMAGGVLTARALGADVTVDIRRFPTSAREQRNVVAHRLSGVLGAHRASCQIARRLWIVVTDMLLAPRVREVSPAALAGREKPPCAGGASGRVFDLQQAVGRARRSIRQVRKGFSDDC